MKNIFISILMLVFLLGNEAVKDDILGGGSINIQLKNGDAKGKYTIKKISLWATINTTNIKKFGIVHTEKTSLSKNNTYEKLLLDTVTYRGIHPSYAEIKATDKKMIFVFDSNMTDVSGNLIIGAGVLRDGTKGGALNSVITVSNSEIDDKAGPVVVSYKTIDNNSGSANGHIDKIELEFSEDISINNVSNTLTIGSSYIKTGTIIASSKTLTIPLTEHTNYDTDIAPNISYKHTTANNIKDRDGNIAPIFALTSSSDTIKAKDTTKPIVVSVGGVSKNAAGDIIYLGFSEKITQNLAQGRISILDSDDSDKPYKLDNAIINQNNGINATITLNETIDGQFAHGRIKIKIETNATDLNDNNFSAYTSDELTIANEPEKPKMTSLIRVKDENKLKLTFNEPMDKNSVETTSNYIISGEYNPSSLSISTATQSSDKKSVILTINNFPSFSSNPNEVRKISIKAKLDIKDYVDNSISTTTLANHNRTYTIAKDKTDPLAESFTLNMNTGKLNITFDEKVVISSFKPASIDINKSFTLSIPLTSKSKATYFNTNMNITLNEDLDMVKNFLKDSTNVNLTIGTAGGGIIDFNANTYNGGKVSLSTNGFTADNVKPELVSWDYNLDKKQFILLFNEAMKVVGYDATKLKINSTNSIAAGTGIDMLSGKSNAKVQNKAPFRTVEINLLASQANAILANANIGTTINTTHLVLSTGSGITDSKGNDIASATVERANASTWKSSKNAVATLKVVSNRWNHISVDNNTTSRDILDTGKVSYIYGHDGTKFIAFPDKLYSHKGYWIKTSNSSGDRIYATAMKHTKGSKDDDLARIRSKTDGKFHLIGIENALSYEEIQAITPSECKSMRIHHYVPNATLANEGWDVNDALSANDALWVLCIK